MKVFYKWLDGLIAIKSVKNLDKADNKTAQAVCSNTARNVVMKDPVSPQAHDFIDSIGLTSRPTLEYICILKMVTPKNHIKMSIHHICM